MTATSAAAPNESVHENSSTPQTRSGPEHPLKAAVRLRAMRKALWMRELWANEPATAHPAAIPNEEVDRILADPSGLAERQLAFFHSNASAAALSTAIEEAEARLAGESNWRQLIQAFGLKAAEQQLLALAVAQALEPSLSRAFAYLHDQPEMTYPTPWLAEALYGSSSDGPGGATPLGKDSALLKWRLVMPAPESIPVQGVWTGWIADPQIVVWLDQGGTADLPAGTVLCPLQKSTEILYPEVFDGATDFLEAVLGVTAEIELIGPEGSGRGTLAGQIAADLGKPLMAVTESELLQGVTEADTAQTVLLAARSAHLRDAILYWRDARDPSSAARRALRSIAGLRIAGRSGQLVDAPPTGTVFRTFELPSLKRSAREQLWSAASHLPVPWQVRDWMLTPGEIVQLTRVAHAGDEAIQQACRRPVESLSLLVRLPLPFDPAELILPSSLEKALNDFENQVRFRWDVYEQWGFDRLCPNGRGLIALFAGPSGTGKTMAAQVLARRLGLELYRLDPAQVINKYIGETEKRLKVIFDECDRAHFLLLIDECEGMFGQRFNSKDAHDRYANLEIDYLLQRLERFQGVAVLSTNRKGDLDPGFLRRIRCIIDFMPPGPAERAKLWASALPAKSPSGEELLQPLDWTGLAERISLTGAEIKLSALNAAFLARAGNEKIGMPHLLEAVRRELAKKGQTLRGFE